MCYDYELEYLARRAEEARKELKKVEEQKKGVTASPKPCAPAAAPAQPGSQEEPVPV